MNIGLDFDDVIANSHSLKPIVARVLYGVEIDPSKFRKDLIVGYLLTADEYLTVVREVYLGKYPMAPVSGALETIRLLQNEGHILRIVTSRSIEGGELVPAQVWMEEHHLDIPIVGVGYGKSKAEVCQGLDIFVDDDSVKLHQLVGIAPHLLFFCWPHNIHEVEPVNSTRVFSWEDIYRFVQNTSSSEVKR